MPRTRFFVNNLQSAPNDSSLTFHIEQVIKSIAEAAHSLSSDGGLYVGRSGVAYMLYYASCFPPLSKHRNEYLKLASSIFHNEIQQISKQKSSKDDASFILGAAGIHVLGCFLAKSGCIPENSLHENVDRYASFSKYCLKPQFLSCGSDELFVGRAGYLSGALTLKDKFGIKVVDDATLNEICSLMVESGKDYARRHRSNSPLMFAYYDSEYLGAAHGLSSILQMILSSPSYLNTHKDGAADVKAAVDWLLSTQQPNGNFAPSVEDMRHGSRPSDELVHWCHGAAGVIYLFAKAYLIWKDEKYLQACIRCGDLIWEKGLLKKGPGICHGVAGSGYAFLLLYRLTKDHSYLEKARRFAWFLFSEEFQAGARRPDNPYSLYEGWAGTVCFLIDLHQPDKAEFPFFNVFNK